MIPKKKTKKIKAKHFGFVTLITIFLSLTTVFVAGFFHSSTGVEKIAEYASSVVLNNTKNKKYCAVTVGATNKSGSIADSYSEFNNLYGIFKQTKVTFASAMNTFNQTTGEKEHNIRIKKDDDKSSDNLSDNLSLFYLGPCGSVKYKSNINEEWHYKHYIYPLETKFSDDAERGKTLSTNYVAYISETHAKNLLERDGVSKINGKYSDDQLKSLLGKAIKVQIDENEKPNDFIIMNIYIEDNYYYAGVREVMGDFVAVSYYVPNNLRQEQKNYYFLSEYTYQNRYFMNYLNSMYSSKEYNVSIDHFNIEGSIDDNYLLSFYYSNVLATFDWVSVLLFVVAALSLLGSFFFIFSSMRPQEGKINSIIVNNLLIAFAPFFIFRIIYKSTGNLTFMSEISSRINAIYLFVFIMLFLSAFVFLNMKSELFKRRLNQEFYEVDI